MSLGETFLTREWIIGKFCRLIEIGKRAYCPYIRFVFTFISFFWTFPCFCIEYADMLNYNDIKPGVAVLVEGEPYVCTWNNIMQKQQRRPVNQTKLKHLIKGTVTEYSFQQSDKMHEAEIESKPAMFIFQDARKGEWLFHELGKPSERFSVTDEMMGDSAKFLKGNTEVTTLWFDGKLFSVKLPVKVEMKVKEAPPDVRGNTAQGGSKIVTLENGTTLNVPMFIKEGDTLIINTESSEYVERAKA